MAASRILAPWYCLVSLRRTESLQALLFSILQVSKIELIVYNIRGQKIKTLIDHTCEIGINTVIWNGTNDSYKQVGTGVYFYKLNVDGKTINTKKMLLLK